MEKIIEWLNISESVYVNAAVVLAAFIVLAKAADIFIDKGLRKLTRFTTSTLDDRIISVVHRPVNYTVILAGLVAVYGYVKPEEYAGFYFSSTVFSVIALIWMVAAIRTINAFIENAMSAETDSTGLSRDLVPLIENVSKIGVIVAAVIVILSIWKVNITPFIASAGIVGVGVAIAAKDTLSNFFGGISVFLDKPYKMGDYVVLDQGERGEVVAIGVRSTRIKTRDDIMITIPNSIIANTKIINESAPIPNYRIRVPVSVSYGTDIKLLEDTLLNIASQNEQVIEEPAPRVRFRSFGDNGLNFELLCWTGEPALRGLAVHGLNTAIYERFNETGIKFPFPQRDVHLYRDEL